MTIPIWADIAARGIHHYYRGYPLCVSIEVTHACTAVCQHCDKGGDEPHEQRATPAEYVQRLREVGSPLYVQISGGEPLTRDDVYEVVQAVRGQKQLPIIIFVSNGSLLEVETYQRLQHAGIDRLSLSLDFPDERHDQFRGCPGLFQHLSEVVPRLAKNGSACGIALNTAITKANFRYVVDIARKAQEWGVGLSFSAYSTLRTGDTSLMLSSEDALVLDQLVDTLIDMRSKGAAILNMPSLLKRTVQYFRDGSIPHCGAGKRFLVIRPDGVLNPCSFFPEAQYSSMAEMQAFVDQNRCEQCYVAIRAYSDRKAREFFIEGRGMLKATLTSSQRAA